MNLKIACITIITLSFLACNGVKKSNTETNQTHNEIVENSVLHDSLSIENTKWIISTLNGKDMSDREKNGQIIYFKLNSLENKINGNAGCNNFTGTYEFGDKQTIKFSPFASTRMMCADAKINEGQIFNIFEKTHHYIIADDLLTLQNVDKSILATFKKALEDSENITEKYWKLKILNGKNISMVENQEREIFFTLKNNNNRITGFAGCNTLSGEYILEENNKIHFKNIAVTMKMCSDIRMNENESEFLQVFEIADHYTIKNDVLSLKAGKNEPLAVFEAVYFQ